MLSKFSVKKPFTVLVMVIAILVLGVVSFSRMTPELFPNINLPYVMVMTPYPGATPEEVEQQVTAPMEGQLATLENLKEMQSYSSESFSLIMLEFNNDANLDVVSVDIRDKIDLASGGFDDRVQKSTIFKMNPNVIPTTVAAVNREGMNEIELSTFVEETLIRQLEGIDGVASVITSGMVDSTIHVALDPDKISALNDRLQSAIGSQTDAAKSAVNSGISGARQGLNQVGSGKEQIKSAQQTLAQQREAITPALEQLVTLVEARDQARAAGQEEIAQATDQLVQQMVAGMAPYKDALKQAGLDLDAMTKDAATARKALTDFNVAMDNAQAQLHNQMAELTGTDAYLRSTIMQLQTTLSTIDAQAAQAQGVDLTTLLSATNLSQIITAENFAMPAGYVDMEGEDAIVSVGEEFTNLKQIEELIIVDLGIPGFDPIRIQDVATVSYLNNGGDVYAKINGEDGILLSFSKQSDSPTAEVSENIADGFKELEAKYEGLHFHIMSDQGEYIDLVVDGVLRNLLLGGALAILILLIFLRDIRPTLITAISIPVSLTFAVVLMYFSGVTLNIISLAGLAVGVGMLVDNSIVVIENIYRLRAQGVSKVQAAVNGAVQVSGAITASTLTTVCVFLPIVFVQGITRDIFEDMALTIGYSLLASLIIALTVVPTLGSTLISKTNEKALLSQTGGAISRYGKVLDFALGHRLLSLLVALVLLVGSGGFLMTRGLEFMPAMASQQITASITMPEDTTNEEAMAQADELMEKVMKIKGVDTVGVMPDSATNGIYGIDFGGGELDMSSLTMYVLLEKDAVGDSASISKKIAKHGKDQGLEMFVSGDADMTAYLGGAQIGIRVFGDDTDELMSAVKAIEKAVGEVDGIQEVSDISERLAPEVTVRVDKNKAMSKGLTVAQVYQALAAMLSEGTTSTSIEYEGGNRDIVIHGTTDYETRIKKDELANLTLTSQNPTTGAAVSFKLSDVATISDGEALGNISRLNQERGVSISGTAKEGENITLLQNRVEKAVDKVDLPDSVRVEYQGQDQEIMESMVDLLKMMALGFLLIYLIMVAQFQSLKSPFIVMFTVPLAFTGGFLALLVTGNVLSVVSMIGFIVLMGIVVNNAIVLIDYINKRRAEGATKAEAIREGAKVRMRPVLMTALTTILGLLPLAFGIGDGAEMVQPVAIVAIGGLLYATMMTLLIIPVVYDLFNKEAYRTIDESELAILEE